MDRETWRLLEMQAEVIRAAAHPVRLAILDYLKAGEQCVCDIARHVGAKRSNVSRHLAVMLKAGIVECHKDGLKVIYSLRTPCILNFLSCVSQVLRARLRSTRATLSKL